MAVDLPRNHRLAERDLIRAVNEEVLLIDSDGAVWRTRMIKSAFEAELKRHSFTIVNAAFDEAIAAASDNATSTARLFIRL